MLSPNEIGKKEKELTTLEAAVTDLPDSVVEEFLEFKIAPESLPEPKWGPIGKEVYERTYSRLNGSAKETWAETVRRVVLGNLSYAGEELQIENEAVDLFREIYSFGILPAGRHLSSTGTALENNRNCFLSGWENKTSVHFEWTAKILFLGGGVGANYSSDLMSVTEPIANGVKVSIYVSPDHPDFLAVKEAAGDSFKELSGGDLVYSVLDNREGWQAAWGRLIDLSVDNGGFRTHDLTFDLSGLRPFGSPLKTVGGTASGPAPLASSLVGISKVLQGATSRRLTGIEAMEIDHHIASSVVAGGTRRSARMSLMNWRDKEVFDFINVKASGIGHWTTNISVETDSDFSLALMDDRHELHDHAQRVLKAVTVGMARNGEPGFVNTEAHSVGENERIRGVNPCSEVSLTPYESCNIGSINLDHYGVDLRGAEKASELLARFLYRATLKSYPDRRAAEVEAKNRRIGLGILGLHGWVMAHGVKLSEFPDSLELREALHSIRETAREAADKFAAQLGLPRSVKVTAVAPTGTISSLVGATPGVSPVIYKRFIRRVRYSDSDPQLNDFRMKGYRIEKDQYAANTSVVSFPVKDAIMERFPEHLVEDSGEISLKDTLRIVQAVQDTLLYGEDGNAVSATCQIPAGMDPEDIENTILPYIHGDLKGITVFPEVSMPQAPFSPLSSEEFEDALRELGENAEFYEMLGDSNDGDNCATGACPIV